MSTNPNVWIKNVDTTDEEEAERVADLDWKYYMESIED